jgi:hypothetical protein
LRKFTGTACLEVATGEGGVRESVRHIRGLLDGLTAAAD